MVPREFLVSCKVLFNAMQETFLFLKEDIMMKDYKQLVAQAVYAAVDGQLNEEAIIEKIEQPKDLKLGDYACLLYTSDAADE